MSTAVIFIGGLITLMGLWALINPTSLIQVLGQWQKPVRFRTAILARFVIGCVLIAAAPSCRVPVIVTVVGIVTLLAAFGILLMGQRRFDDFVARWLHSSPSMLRAWSLVAVAFGVILIYAA